MDEFDVVDVVFVLDTCEVWLELHLRTRLSPRKNPGPWESETIEKISSGEGARFSLVRIKAIKDLSSELLYYVYENMKVIGKGQHFSFEKTNVFTYVSMQFSPTYVY